MQSFTTKQMLCTPVFTFLLFSFLTITSSNAQNHAYLQSPENRTIINSQSPTFSWKGTESALSYTIEVFEASYSPGNNFNSIKLDDYEPADAFEGSNGYEASGLAFHEMRDNQYVTIDDNSSRIYTYNSNFSATGRSNDGALNGDQHEGISYLYDDYFMSISEFSNELTFAKFNYTNNSFRSVNVIRIINVTSNNYGNQGLEGISYNPINNKAYVVKEKDPIMLFEFDVPKAPNFSGSINLKQPFIIQNQNWQPRDIAGLYHLSLNRAMSATATGEHLLMLSEESSSILEIDLSGNLISELEIDVDDFNNVDNEGFFKPEGIAYHNGTIWIVSEGSFQIPAIFYGFVNEEHQDPKVEIKKSIYKRENITSVNHTMPECLLQNNSSYCWNVTAKRAGGSSTESAYFNFTTRFQLRGCTDEQACNYDACATQSDNSCKYDDCLGICGGNNEPGSSCNDGFSTTSGDYLNEDCDCIGKGCTNRNACNYNRFAKEDNGSCLEQDCRGVCGGRAIKGSSCTVNGVSGIYNNNCKCIKSGCKDPYACNYNPTASLSDNSSCKFMEASGICFCESNITHTKLNSNYKQFYYAEKNLNSTANVYLAKDIAYFAGESVVLLSGFRLTNKANLSIKIKQCNP